jgi:hypothetical protein
MPAGGHPSDDQRRKGGAIAHQQREQETRARNRHAEGDQPVGTEGIGDQKRPGEPKRQHEEAEQRMLLDKGALHLY